MFSDSLFYVLNIIVIVSILQGKKYELQSIEMLTILAGVGCDNYLLDTAATTDNRVIM